jgi:hypothetical protein
MRTLRGKRHFCGKATINPPQKSHAEFAALFSENVSENVDKHPERQWGD